MWIRIGCADPDPESTLAFIRIRIQGVKSCLEVNKNSFKINLEISNLFYSSHSTDKINLKYK